MHHREQFVAPFEDIEVRASGAGEEYTTMRGYAVVYGAESLPLSEPGTRRGMFIERFAPGAFTDILRGNPDVHLLSEHDWSRPLARTKNGSLEVTEDANGLRVWARINTNTSYGRDEVVKLRDGLIDGMSFGFDVNPDGEDWDYDGGVVLRTIRRASALFDVSNVARGAYPAAHVALARSYQRAVQEGRAPASADHLDVAGPATAPGASAVASEGSETTELQTRRAPDITVLRARLSVAKSKSL